MATTTTYELAVDSSGLITETTTITRPAALALIGTTAKWHVLDGITVSVRITRNFKKFGILRGIFKGLFKLFTSLGLFRRCGFFRRFKIGRAHV